MRRMREHVYRLHCLHLIILVQQRKVARLGCRIAAYIYNAPRACTDYRLHHVGVIPARGGSVITMSGRPFAAMKSSVSMSFMSPA